VLVFHLILVSHLQPFARYAYRAAAFAVTNVSFQTLLRPGQFITIGKNTYRVEALSPDGEQFEGIFLFSEADDSGTLTVTSAAGQIEKQSALVPVLLHLENGVQQFVPNPPEAGDEQTTRPPPLTLRFGSFTSDLSGTEPQPFRPRGEHERELTIPELLGLLGRPAEMLPDGVDPHEIEAELAARLVRNVSIAFLPLLAVPLALSPRRAKRSYGFLVGVVLVVGYNQVVSTGESLADDGQMSSLVAVWVPFLVFATLSTAHFFYRARKVPDPGKSSLLGAGIDALVAGLAKRLPWRTAA
jgi:lipopolysaccharide export system permease protein